MAMLLAVVVVVVEAMLRLGRRGYGNGGATGCGLVITTRMKRLQNSKFM